jgi:squalene-hopene/tetraprenyl-beta-curcumene cyclase
MIVTSLAVSLVALCSAPAMAQLPDEKALTSMDAELAVAMRKGVKYLHSRWNPKDSEESFHHPGLTGLVLLAMLRTPDPYDDTDPFIRKPIEELLKLQKENGGIYKDMLGNYITSVALLALCEARDLKRIKDQERLARVEQAITRARAYLVELQADEGEGYTPADKMYGGVGYGGDMRPDLSNTQLALEAARAAGLDPQDPFFQKAIKFLERTQNRSENSENKEEWAAVVNDGGFMYYPGKSYAQDPQVKGPDGKVGHRSYGAMTYAGIKSYIYAGLKWDDPRVQAAMGWIESNYTVSEHPAAGFDGYLYYLHTFARTMDLWSREHRRDELTDSEGARHHWRYDLAKHLIKLQSNDGAWSNDKSGRWMEGDPVLGTTYAILALSYCHPLTRSFADAGKPAPEQPGQPDGGDKQPGSGQ